MSIGTIIFIITIAISLFSAVSDKSHEKRQKQNKPQNTKEKVEPQKGGGFLEKMQQKLEEFEKEFADFDEPTEPSEPQPTQKPNREKTVRPQPTQYEKQAEPTKPKVKEKQDQSTEMQQMLDQHMRELDQQLDKERQKRIARIERRAKNIIQDSYLSNRTKQFKLKQLLEENNATTIQQGDLTFSNNEVVNGLIWSEVLNRPKQL
ncbi:hypothetical protein [Staphylococcus intermedius]|uniref:Putative staphylococcal protein n=1 Tax=Staphylococcus intermedius NCTC 11048 TaxID=1141106 RepID=A0A380G6C5_STAIN|nr:hypothetical protein [Staphylococcus intermedius]PCF64790.1 hypothetical protein B5C04_01730 [Staphylococcus intermedius]PCF80400.1 hypothetical protein B4W74_01745 [Staphylococcus intermedius]PCF81750.1 hypothetical protein B4W70_01730 [Staphylococcus intermedius]PCF88088.1 hypothetical protein B4W75_04775 [Staphylococcus intermedius]PCF88801.1 hypothetical protein B4W76_00770 [Staphylococcus intermedius]